MTLCNPTRPPKAPSPDTVTVVMRASAYGFGVRVSPQHWGRRAGPIWGAWTFPRQVLEAVTFNSRGRTLREGLPALVLEPRVFFINKPVAVEVR